MDQGERREFLIRELLQENVQCQGCEIPAREEEQKLLLRGLMNVRLPRKISGKFLKVQDEYLQAETVAKGITEPDGLSPVAYSEGIGRLYESAVSGGSSRIQYANHSKI